MVTIEDKIEGFKKIINEDIKKQNEAEIQKILEETEKKITAYKAKKYEEIEKLKREYASKLYSRQERVHSKTQKEGQNIIILATKSIYEEFFQALKAQLKEDYAGDCGIKYLKTKLASIKGEVKSDDVVYLPIETYERDSHIIQDFFENPQIRETAEIKIGGFEVENKEKTYRINCTLDFLLEEQHTKLLSKVKKELEIEE